MVADGVHHGGPAMASPLIAHSLSKGSENWELESKNYEPFCEP